VRSDADVLTHFAGGLTDSFDAGHVEPLHRWGEGHGRVRRGHSLDRREAVPDRNLKRRRAVKKLSCCVDLARYGNASYNPCQRSRKRLSSFGSQADGIQNMATEIIVPDMGTSADQVTLVRWLKSEGDRVKRGEPLCEVETDKAVSEVEAFAEGVLLQQLVPEGAQIRVGTTIAYIGQEGETIAPADARQPIGASLPAAEPAAPQAETTTTTAQSPDAPEVSLMVRNLARRLGVDFSRITATGPGEMILRDDVIRAAKAGGQAAAGATAEPDELPLSANQQAVVRRITESHRRIIPVNFVCRINASQMLKKRMEVLRQGKAKPGIDAIFVHAVSQVVKQFPHFRCYMKDDRLLRIDAVNVGVAVSNDEALYIPVIKNADAKSLTDIDRQIRELIDKARRNRLQARELSGATFTISNLGMYPVQSFNVIIPPGQAAALAIGCIEEVPIFRKNALAAEPIVSVVLSVDHRFINGRLAGQFLAQLKDVLEHL